MKRMLLTIAVVIIASAVSGQRTSLDDFFSRYSDRDGYTSVVISGDLLKFLGESENSDRDGNAISKITSIRLVVREKDNSSSGESLVSEIRGIIRRSRYDELMSVKDDGADIRFMARMEMDMVRELLLVIDGKDEAVIHVEGNLTRDEASELFTSNGEGLAILEGLEIRGK
jgi:metallophosphoesterase superfamily enzyme